MKRKVFVYGTLMSDEPNHSMMERAEAELLGAGRVPYGRLYRSRWSDAYPCASFFENYCDGVSGEVYLVEMSSAAWQRIREMEEGAGYVLRRVRVILGTGQRVEADSFDHVDENGRGRLISTGDWRQVSPWMGGRALRRRL